MDPAPQKLSKAHRMSYSIGRGEKGVLSYEPYKSTLLPFWRFKSVAIARTSASNLYQKFIEYYEERDFIGCDMARKFIQMGMTRAKRYANYKGGRKYLDGKDKANLIEKSSCHAGKEEKEMASSVFRETLERCKAHQGYQVLKREFMEEKKEWEKLEKSKPQEKQ